MTIYLKFTKKNAKDTRKEKKIKSVCKFIGLKNNKLHYKCEECKKTWFKPVNGLIRKFPKVYKFCNGDTNKFILLLRKGVYPYGYMDSWERFNEESLRNKIAFSCKLYLKDIIDEHYAHAQKMFDEFGLKNLGDNHDLYVQRDTLLLADVFENLRNKCIEIYELDPAHFLSAPGLAWQACLKKTEVELELLANNDRLLMLEKGTKGRICHALQRYAKTNNKYMKNYDKNIESSCMYGQCHKLPADGFK